MGTGLEVLGNMALGIFVEKVKKLVIGKWSTYRFNEFLRALHETLESEKLAGFENSDADQILEKLFDDGIREEMLFECYRRSALTASRELGPRIIGILLAYIIHEERLSTEEEDKIFMAAERLSDRELRNFAKAYKVAEAEFIDDVKDNLPFPIYRKNDQQNLGKAFFIPSLHHAIEEHGDWIIQWINIGIIYEDRIESEQPGKELFSGMTTSSGIVNVEYNLMVHPKYRKLVDLIERAAGPNC